MTGPTHRQFAIAMAFIVSILLYKYTLSSINYYLAMCIIIRISEYGARFPDVDGNWKNVKDKTVPNKIINALIHATGGKHRSWQTHSIDIVVIVSIAALVLPPIALSNGIISEINFEVFNIIMLGFLSGWVSHIIADMLNGVGVRIVCWSDKTVALVPKHIGKFRFNTAQEWESYVYRAIRCINIVFGILTVLYPVILSEWFKNFIMEAIK